METLFGFLEVEAMPFGSINDGIEGEVLMVFIAQTIFDVVIIIRS